MKSGKLARTLAAVGGFVLGSLVASAGTPALAATIIGPQYTNLVITDQGSGGDHGTNFGVFAFTTSVACNPLATRHVTKVVAVTATNPADQTAASGWVNRNMYSPSQVGLPGPFEAYQSSSNFQAWASTYGLTVVPGNYTFEFRCQDNLGVTIYETFQGHVVFDTATSWHALNPAPKATTTTALTPAPSPATAGQSVALTATVTPSTATGSVEFFDGATSLGTATISGGTATLNHAFSSPGTVSLTAAYGGDTANLASTSPAVSLLVNPAPGAPTTTALVVAPAAPTDLTPVTLSAVVAAGTGTPDGAVTFYDGATSVGTATLAGGAASVTVTLAAGSHSIVAKYPGVAAYAPSESAPQSVTVTAAPKDTTTTITAAPITATVGATIGFTVTVTGPAGSTPTGTVEIFDGEASLGTAPLSGGKATLSDSSLSVGTHTVTAKYAGATGAFNASTSAGVQVTIDAASASDAATTTTLTVSPVQATLGTKVTMTATIGADAGTGRFAAPMAAPAAGSVSFYDGAQLLGSAAVDASGTAAFSIDNLAVGSHSLTATFTGAAGYSPSTSPATTVQILAASGSTDTGGTAGSGGTSGGTGSTVSAVGGTTSSGSGQSLARTGAEVAPLLATALGLVAAGAGLLIAGRRRYRARHSAAALRG